MATNCCARTSSGFDGMRSASMAPSRIRSVTTAACTRSPRYFGKTTPVETAPTWCPARPTRWSPEATEGGDSTWTTRSTAPMSMPSSRLEVATTAGSPRLEVLLDLCPLLLGDRTVVGAGQQGGGAPGRTGLGHDLGRGVGLREGGRRIVGVERGPGRPLVGDLVQPVAQPLGQPPGVGEDDGGAVGLDEIGDALLHMRPDRGLVRLPGVAVRGGGAAQLAQVLDGDDDREVELLRGPRLDDLHLALRGQEAGHFVDRPDRRGQADAPGRAGQQLVEPLQRQGEMGAPLGPGDRVHLVEDHGLDV